MWVVGLRVVTLSLHPTPEQAAVLEATMRAFNAACQYISDVAWVHHEFRRVRVHRLTYRDVRERFGLSSQLAVRAIGVVTDSYKADREVKHTFRPDAAVVYDERVMKLRATTVSLRTVTGRESISSWALGQFTAFLAYKCADRGVPFVLVDPRDTSRTCSRCGHCEKANRHSQSSFLCRRCGFAAHADWNGAENIRQRAVALFGAGAVQPPTRLEQLTLLLADKLAPLARQSLTSAHSSS
jgi:IS605 OrfB family transposase